MNSVSRLILTAALAAVSSVAFAAGRNIAPIAKVTVSDSYDEAHGAAAINDGVILNDGKGEWICKGSLTPWGELHLPWVHLEWEEETVIDRVLIYDRPTMSEHLSGGSLVFSDGSRISVTAIPNDGSAKEICFAPKKVKWMRFDAGDGAGLNLGLSEIEVFGEREDKNYVEWVDPYIETTCGRWFYCTPGGLPMGMVAAHAFTRNKNQGGGGYNYNFNEILGFSQINDWMVSGPNIMPVTGEINPMLGMDGWKSEFKHNSEIIQPGYHRLFLDRYDTWVEYTATDRVAFYRIDYTSAKEGKILIDVGSKLGNCSMNGGWLAKLSPDCVVGKVSTTDRFWGGPDDVELYFAIHTNQPFSSIDGWDENGGRQSMIELVAGNNAGMVLNFDLKESSQVLCKIAMSYTSCENAIENLMQELPDFDFDATRAKAQATWNEMFSRIDIDSPTTEKKVKFYTDLWHVLLGRHKINDVNGYYPDYTGEPYIEKRSHNPLTLRQLPLDGDGRPVHNMYGFDGIWLTQWNLNILWGLAWPEIMDDFTACLVQYSKNGKLLPRGACAGGYSFIMTGCPSTNMLVSAYMQGIMKKADPEEAYAAIKFNHLPGGMMSYESADDLKFYMKNGWCPGNAGKTMEWAFQDWGLSMMAQKMGKKSDAKTFAKRAHSWTPLFNNELGLILPKDKEGNWTNTDPLSGAGWVEANAWQATWSLSHDLDRLSALMGGNDAFAQKLNYAFEQAAQSDFIASYSNGYVSYANQPGCSNAHLFSHVGKPWLTQYWVRRVQEQAYSGITPDKGYGGHDEDQGQMGGVSALMSIGLFGVQGMESQQPCYDITSPIFNEVTITLNPEYCSGRKFTIKTHDLDEGCYIQKATLDGETYDSCQITRERLISGGTLEIWLGNEPNCEWGLLLKH